MNLADHLTIENLLRSWLRETGLEKPDADGVLRIDLAAVGTRVEADVVYWSATGMHRLANVRLPGGARVDAPTLAGLMGREAAVQHSRPATHLTELVDRVRDSVRRTSAHIDARRADPDPDGGDPYLLAEQALLHGHPFHPAPKSRTPLTGAEGRRFSPEMRGFFALHWFAADPAVVTSDSALPDTAAEILAGLAGPDLALPDGMVAVPAHPWQAREVCTRPVVQRLLADGRLRELGPVGPLWYPTSSLRTVYRPGAPYQLKLSLGLSITNSRRELLGKELRRGIEIHRLLEAGLGKELAAAHPGFAIVRDPAWQAVEGAPGLEVDIREAPAGDGERVECLAGLVEEQPTGSRLARVLTSLQTAGGKPLHAVAAEWFGWYLQEVVVPVLWLYAEHGLALEAHQQNTLVTLDAHGWPIGGAYRDNQGFYVCASRAGHLARWLPNAGRSGDAICPDAVVEERLGYYLGINNVLGLIGAMGAQGLADETELLRAWRAVLHDFGGSGVDRRPEPVLVTRLLDAPTLRCKANLLTRVAGLDELVEPLETQSVYVDLPNPLLTVATSTETGEEGVAQR